MNGLPRDVSEAWGRPQLVTHKAIYEYCDCSSCCHTCEGHFIRNEPLPKSEWHWIPTVVDMSLSIGLLENDESKLVSLISRLPRKQYDWAKD